MPRLANGSGIVPRRNAIQACEESGKPTEGELADYNVDRARLMSRSPRIAVRFMDGEAVFTHVPSAPGKPLNIGRALRVAIVMYRSRKSAQRRAGFHEYDRAMPVPEIFQVRSLETDELFDVRACNKHTVKDRQSYEPERPAALASAGSKTALTSAAPHTLCILGTSLEPFAALPGPSAK
jgi:hypothetical protein